MASNWANIGKSSFDKLPMDNSMRQDSWGSNKSYDSQDEIMSDNARTDWKNSSERRRYPSNTKLVSDWGWAAVTKNKKKKKKVIEKAKDKLVNKMDKIEEGLFGQRIGIGQIINNDEQNPIINQTLGSLPSGINFKSATISTLLNKTRDTLENLTKLEERVKILESFHNIDRVGGYIKKKKSKTKKRKKKSKTKKRKTKRRRKSKTKKRIKRKHI